MPAEGLGLVRGEVRLAAYDPAWDAAFLRLRLRLLKIVPESRIEHVGSTSVPGCDAKPIIDVSVGLAEGSRLRVDAARSIGLHFRSVSPTSTLFIFTDSSGIRIAHVHVARLNSEDELRLLRFRDYLRAHPRVVGEYVAAKHRALATSKDREGYTARKAPFFRKLEPRVLRWARRTRWTPQEL